MFRVLFCWILIIHCLQDSFLESLSPRSTIHDTEPLSRSQNNINITDKCNCGLKVNPKIVNGQIAKPHAYPWMVALYHMDGFHCGGSLINDRYVLTAAHCTSGKNESSFRAILGLHDRGSFENHTLDSDYIREIQRIIVHPEYSREKDYENDISLMELKQPVGQLGQVNQICLPFGKEESDFINHEAKVIGWGKTQEVGGNKSQILRETTVMIISNEKCQLDLKNHVIKNSMICGFGNDTDACKSDSGGPMFVEKDGRYQLIGIVSWGDGCARPIPAVYTRVTKFLDWIIAGTQNGIYCN